MTFDGPFGTVKLIGLLLLAGWVGSLIVGAIGKSL